MANKPKWVEAAEHAEECLIDAGNSDPERADTLNRTAQHWMELARIYRDAE